MVYKGMMNSFKRHLALGTKCGLPEKVSGTGWDWQRLHDQRLKGNASIREGHRFAVMARAGRLKVTACPYISIVRNVSVQVPLVPTSAMH